MKDELELALVLIRTVKAEIAALEAIISEILERIEEGDAE